MGEQSKCGPSSSNSTKKPQFHDDSSRANSHDSHKAHSEIPLSDSSDEPMIVDEIRPKVTTPAGLDGTKSKTKREKGQEGNKNMKRDVKTNSSQATTKVNNQKRNLLPASETQCQHKSNRRSSDSSNWTTQTDVTNGSKRSGSCTYGSKSETRSYDMRRPQDILAYVLDNSEFKTPNLSQLLMEKFNDPDYKRILDHELRDVTYQDTIISIDIPMSVLPTRYKTSKVLIQPHAILNLARPDPPIHRKARSKINTKLSSTSEKKVNKEISLTELNEKLADLPYVDGYTPSQKDLETLKKLSGEYDKFVHIKRWVNHMASFSDAERASFPTTAEKRATQQTNNQLKDTNSSREGKRKRRKKTRYFVERNK